MNTTGKRPIIAAAVGIPLALFLAAYLVFFRGDSTPRLVLDDTPAGTGQAISPDPAGEWTIAAGSVAGYRVREKLARLPAQSDAVGRTESITGGFTLVRQANTSLVARDVSVTVDMTALKSDETRRDNKMKTDGLETDRFPTATFKSVGDIPIPAEAEDAVAVKLTLTGDLTIHGVTKRVSIPAEGRATESGIQIAGSINFPMADYDIDPPNVGGFVTVDDSGTLEFKLLLTKK